MSNTIKAIINLVTAPQLQLVDYYNSRHRANSEGASLEEYIKDLYADTLNEQNEEQRRNIIKDVFSYIGKKSRESQS